MTEQAATTSGAQTASYKPWHTKKGIDRHLKVRGKILPKHLLRPYFYTHPHRIDDKQYVVENIESLKDGLHFVYGFLYLIALGTAFLGWTAQGDFPQLYYAAAISLAIAIPAHLISKRFLKSNRFNVYDRETGTIRREYGWRNLKYREIPFWESEGYLMSAHNQMGLMRHMLMLRHPTKGSFLLIEGADLDLPLGYWSFLVQYMDKSKPLPDIPYLADHPNREPGLGDWESWQTKMERHQIVDPYITWLAELEKHPEWDVANYGRDLSKHKQYETWIFLAVSATLLSIVSLIVVLINLLF